jgi:6-phospho-beta-glucosidase
MKITIIGGAGVRTPLLVQTIAKHQSSLKINQLSLMDIDLDHLKIMEQILQFSLDQMGSELPFVIETDAKKALAGADFVILTFRVGGIKGRVIDERVPLSYGVLGQETTGPGGFAMGLRTIPVLLDYIQLMKQVCPNAWLINFANPSGMLSEAAISFGGWKKTVGVCDAPSQMKSEAARILQAPEEDVFLDYFGLNHLGWVRSIIYKNMDQLPKLLDSLSDGLKIPGLSFTPSFLQNLGMIPNEYLYYYYFARRSVENILKSSQTRGEQIQELNHQLFADMTEAIHNEDQTYLIKVYSNYLKTRSDSYMSAETGKTGQIMNINQIMDLQEEGYAGVAIELIGALSGIASKTMILNVPNQGSISGMNPDDVVEIPNLVSQDSIRPLPVKTIPDLCLGLMKQVKTYEKLTIQAAVEKSYQKALLALTLHPLVMDSLISEKILNDFIQKHSKTFPALK